jgi:hypothetical protein
MLSRSCNTPVIESLAEDCKLSACGRQPIVPFGFCCHLIWCSYFVFVVIVFFKKSVYRSSLGERFLALHPTYIHRPSSIVSRHIRDNVSF